MPTAAESATATAPASRETRAPCRMRLSRSRPSGSVPNGCAADGPCPTAVGSTRSGGYGLSGASTAASTSSSTRLPPTTAEALRDSRRRMPGRVAPERGAAAGGAGATVIATGASDTGGLQPDPGIHARVEQVDERVDHDDEHRGHQQAALDDDEVAGEDAVDDQPAEPGDPEHGLGEHETAEHLRHLQAGDRDDRDHRVGQDVAAHDRA